MRRALLDVNVLLALPDADHVQHDRATAWLDEEIDGGWVTCAITQNGFIRIISQPRCTSPVPPAVAAGALAVAHGGRFVTFDARVSLPAVVGATEDHLTVL